MQEGILCSPSWDLDFPSLATSNRERRWGEGERKGEGRGEIERETLTHVQTHGHYSFEKSNAGSSKG